jgi:hypothetical protein
VVALDDGDAVVVGGRDDTGELVRELELYDARARRMRTLEPSSPEREDAVAAGLPGGRVAWLACDALEAEAPSACELGVLLRDADARWTSRVIELDWPSVAPRGLSQIAMLALADGTLLVTGRDLAAAIGRRAFVIDVSRATIEKREATRVPTALVAMQDGSVAELDPSGTSLRREALRSRYQSPSGNLIDPKLEYVALDGPERFEIDEDGVRARDESARLDVVGLRFAGARVTLEVEGDATLLVRDATHEVAVSVAGATLKLGACRARMPKGARLVVTREGTKLQARGEGGDERCDAKLDASLVSLAVRAEPGTLVRSLEIERR